MCIHRKLACTANFSTVCEGICLKFQIVLLVSKTNTIKFVQGPLVTCMHANKASVQTYKASVHSQYLHWPCTDVSKSLNAALLKQNKYNKNVQGPIVTCMHASRASLHAQKASLHCQYLHCTLTDFSQLLSTFLNAPPLSSTFFKIPQHFPTSSTFLNFP